MSQARISPRLDLHDFYIPPNRDATIVGYASVSLPDVGLVIHDVKVCQNRDGAWATVPRRETNLGKKRHIVSFLYYADFQDFGARVVEMVRVAYPGAFKKTDTPISAGITTKNGV